MISSLRSRFVLSHILPILLVVPLAGLALLYLLETQVLLTELSRDLTQRADLIAKTSGGVPSVWLDSERADRFVRVVSTSANEYIFLMSADGVMLAGEEGYSSAGLPVAEQVDLALAGQQVTVIQHGLVRQQALVLMPVVGANEQLIGIVGVGETLEGLASQFGQLRWLVLGILLVELFLGLALAVALAQRTAAPVANVAAAVGDIAAGQRVEPVPEEGPDELRELARSVNALAERLRNLEETRRRLLANIVHELGRPLGAVRSAVHVLRRDPDQNPAVRAELLDGIEQAVARTQPLLDDLAQLHGQVLGLVKLQRQPVALDEWLGQTLLSWRAAAVAKGQDWVTHIPHGLPPVDIDPDRMAQALGNLVSNAVKYTPREGLIRVAAEADQNEARITVSDTGPGIGSDEQDAVFEPFYRSQRHERFPQGLGLGLTIARDIVLAHGGRLELSSQPDQGSRFTIHLPLAEEPA
ncbi:MAG: HAMP domain-containing sensor histidine kinase [Candidatus Promineifilaceae bacterium]|nr:HAMP domain-containing sensor histidine kinase [Candidatus Promineifilaceae bacterium]